LLSERKPVALERGETENAAAESLTSRSQARVRTANSAKSRNDDTVASSQCTFHGRKRTNARQLDCSANSLPPDPVRQRCCTSRQTGSCRRKPNGRSTLKELRGSITDRRLPNELTWYSNRSSMTCDERSRFRQAERRQSRSSNRLHTPSILMRSADSAQTTQKATVSQCGIRHPRRSFMPSRRGRSLGRWPSSLGPRPGIAPNDCCACGAFGDEPVIFCCYRGRHVAHYYPRIDLENTVEGEAPDNSLQDLFTLFILQSFRISASLPGSPTITIL
jgi:hypothetical protein